MNAHKDWRILFAAARNIVATATFWDFGPVLHPDVVAVKAAAAAADAGARAGFCLRHARRAADLALLDRGPGYVFGGVHTLPAAWDPLLNRARAA